MLRAASIVLVLLPVLAVYSYSFFSSVEAYFGTDHTKRCIGDCYEHDGEFLCTVNWFGAEQRCVATNNRTRRYRTDENVECVSNCDKFGYNYEWCAISNTKWGGCTRRLALTGKRTHSTTNEYKTCADACEKRGSSYSWCNVVGDTWYRCNPDDITHTFDYSTSGNEKCATRCSLASDGMAYCYTKSNKYQVCFLNPTYLDELNIIDANLHRHCPFSEYELSGTLRLCGRHRSVRASDDEDENELYFNCDEDVETIAVSHSANNPTVTLRRADHTNIITMATNPILSYTVLPTISYFSANPLPVDLPLVVRALLTSHTLAPLNVRDSFTSRVDANYNGLDRNLQHVNYDERGHILASRLGGPMETFNVFPQAWRANRGRNSLWYGLETDLDNFLRNRPTRHVFFTAVLSYATDDHHVLVHRPTAVMLRVRAYDNGVMVHLDGSPVTSIRPNVLENVYFSNNPDHSCAPLPATTRKPKNG